MKPCRKRHFTCLKASGGTKKEDIIAEWLERKSLVR
jgi:hypothetical protein